MSITSYATIVYGFEVKEFTKDQHTIMLGLLGAEDYCSLNEYFEKCPGKPAIEIVHSGHAWEEKDQCIVGIQRSMQKVESNTLLLNQELLTPNPVAKASWDRRLASIAETFEIKYPKVGWLLASTSTN